MGKFKSFLEESYKTTRPKLFRALEEQFTGDDIYVHFTSYRKDFLTSNKNPYHNDPIGVYAFPRKYLLELEEGQRQSFMNMYFAYIIRPNKNSKILDLNKLTLGDGYDLLNAMGIPEEWMLDEKTYHKNGGTAGHRFIGSIERYRHETKKDPNSRASNVSWNALFKKTPYNTLLDNGDAIIHSNEPYQIIFLNTSSFDVLDIIDESNLTEGDAIAWIRKHINTPISKIRKHRRDMYAIVNFENGAYVKVGRPMSDHYKFSPDETAIRAEGRSFSERDFTVKYKELVDNSPKIKELNKFIEDYVPYRRSGDNDYERMYLQFCEAFGFSPNSSKTKRNRGGFLDRYERILSTDYNGYTIKAIFEFLEKDEIVVSLYINGSRYHFSVVSTVEGEDTSSGKNLFEGDYIKNIRESVRRSINRMGRGLQTLIDTPRKLGDYGSFTTEDKDEMVTIRGTDTYLGEKLRLQKVLKYLKRNVLKL